MMYQRRLKRANAALVTALFCSVGLLTLVLLLEMVGRHGSLALDRGHPSHSSTHGGTGRALFLQNNKRTSDISNMQRVTIQCTVEPLFFCPDCRSALEQEQEDVWKLIQETHPQARLLAKSQKIMNALYVMLPTAADASQLTKMISGVRGHVAAQDYHYQSLDAARSQVGATYSEKYCATGKGIRIAVLDSGIDYTHKLLGGPGTQKAYQEAYGTSGPESPENKQRDGLFPTERVVDGYDVLGDGFQSGSDDEDTAIPDDDPIDSLGT